MTKRPGTKSGAKGTKNLPNSAFAYPSKRKYPINTRKRARNALARAKQKGTFGSYSHVARRVRARYGNAITSVGRARGRVNKPGLRRKRRKSTTRRRRKRG